MVLGIFGAGVSGCFESQQGPTSRTPENFYKVQVSSTKNKSMFANSIYLFEFFGVSEKPVF